MRDPLTLQEHSDRLRRDRLAKERRARLDADRPRPRKRRGHPRRRQPALDRHELTTAEFLTLCFWGTRL